MCPESTADNTPNSSHGQLQSSYQNIWVCLMGELVILQRCQSAVLNIHAISQPIRYAFLQHLILYTFLQQQTHFRNIFYTFLKIIN